MFTRKEHSFFNDPYFKIVREEQQYIEVQSVSTGHCWNVFKNQFELTCKVKLYHKHKLTDQYYHEHRQCRTVAEAVKEIKEHDEYVLEQAKADENSQFICREYDMIAAENLALHLRSEGILSIVLPAKITFGGGSVKELREFLEVIYRHYR